MWLALASDTEALEVMYVIWKAIVGFSMSLFPLSYVPDRGISSVSVSSHDKQNLSLPIMDIEDKG